MGQLDQIASKSIETYSWTDVIVQKFKGRFWPFTQALAIWTDFNGLVGYVKCLLWLDCRNQFWKFGQFFWSGSIYAIVPWNCKVNNYHVGSEKRYKIDYTQIFRSSFMTDFLTETVKVLFPPFSYGFVTTCKKFDLYIP